MGIVLWAADRYAKRDREIDDMNYGDAIAIGLAQMFAIIPGVSRSGSTISAGRALRLNRESAAVFSFLMSMPIIAAASILKVPHVIKSNGLSATLIVGVLASAISGWRPSRSCCASLRPRSYGLFAAYRVILGLIVLAIAFSR